MKEEIFEMDGAPARITIYGNWFLTQGDVYWKGRYFYLHLKHEYASFTEYESKNWVEEQQDEINQWGMDYPQDEVTTKEVSKLFWHLVVTKDTQYLESQIKKHQEILNKIKGEQK
jgi:hypothetical protein